MALVPRPVWVLRPNWKTELTEGKEWLTSILASTSGAEQRRAMRYWPRRTFEFDVMVYGEERAWFDNFLHDTSAVEYYLPIFKDTSIARFNPAFPNRVYMDTTAGTEYYVGGPLVLLDTKLSRHEVLEITGIATTYVNCATPHASGYSNKVRCYPAIVARLTEQPKFKRHSDGVQTAPVSFIGTKGRAITQLFSGIEAGPMILDGLIVNSYHQEEGRGGYFHSNSGTSEGQFIMIYGLYRAFEVLVGGTAEEDRVARYYRDLAEQMMDAMGDGSFDGPILRQPIPDDPEVITLLHWLFAARGDIPMQNTVYAQQATRFSTNKLRIPNNARGADVYKVWKIYPASSELLFESPYSAAYDIATPIGETQTTISTAQVSRRQFETIVTIPSTNDVGGSNAGINAWKITFGYSNAALIPVKAAQEAYPNWTLIEPGYAACAPDTFKWFEQAATAAIANETRAGYATKWTKLRNAMRRTAVKGQNLSDLREIIKPMPGFDVIPSSGAPDGMFCYSDHERAIPPVKPGLDVGWTGYDFWTRASNGDIIGTIPTGGKAQVQIGRGAKDQWRSAETYQAADNYLYIAMSTSKSPGAGEDVLVFMSETQAFVAETRWYAKLQDLGNWAHVSGAGSIIEYFVPRAAFLSRLYDGDGNPYWGSGFSVGQKFENFGLSIEMAGPYTVRLRALRLVATANAAGVAGAKMPFFPGSMPFAINADTKRQQFIGWNGSPFHGYQLPDFWWWLSADATAVHPSLTVADLPIPAADGSLTFPISATNPNGTTKPKHALLAEQQIMFLVKAAAKWTADGGGVGPFAHTFVLNTPARESLGNPTPHSWVYVNDDPNTRWLGYQVRAVESLALLGYLCRSTTSWQKVNTLSLDLVEDWLKWLNARWTSIATGTPTDYIDPGIGTPLTLYDEPHAPGILLRACLWLRLSRPSTASWLDPLFVRLFNYIETLWRTSGDMRYTWSIDPANHQWYGFWHGEIMTAYADMLSNPSGVPAGISLVTLRTRLVQTQWWMETYGVKSSSIAPVSNGPMYRDYPVLVTPPDERETLTRDFERIIAEFDTGLGLTAFKETGDRLYGMQTYTWYLKGRDEQRTMTNFLEAIKGRWLPFWVPTFMADFTLATPATEGALFLEVNDVGFTSYGGPVKNRQDLFIHYTDGTYDCRRIRSSVLGAGTEVLNFAEGISGSKIARISLMGLMRFNQDRIEMHHRVDSMGVATCSAMLRAAPELRDPRPAFYTPL